MELSAEWEQFLDLFRRCLYFLYFLRFLKHADICRVLHLCSTVSSENSGCQENHLFRCLSEPGCGVPGVMASRTIENERDRRMTIMTTTFIPCGAKLPIIALIATALFDGAWWVAPSCIFCWNCRNYNLWYYAKKTKIFSAIRHRL